MDRSSTARRWLTAAAIALAALATTMIVPGSADGQCPITDPACGVSIDDEPPTIGFVPDGATFGSRPQTVTVEFCDNVGLNDATRWIELNGTDVTSSFSWESGGCSGAESHQATGTISLDIGANTLEGRICDDEGNCNVQSVTYSFDDGSSPTVAVSPGGGTYTTDARQVTVDWCDDDALDDGSRSVVLNGSDVTGSFDYGGGAGGCSDSKRSEGTVTLVGGQNTLEATICDVSGNCQSTAAAYTYDEPDTTAPEISIDPAGGTFTSQDQGVTVEWCDTESLDASTRSIALNGQDVTSQFDYGDGSQGCTVAKASTDADLTLAPGSNTLDADICDDAGNCGSATATYTYEAPPTVDLAPHESEYLDTAKCVLDCFDASVSYSTPAYVSRDRPRSLTLHYRSAQAAPRGRVQAHVAPAEGAPVPDRFSLRLQRPDGTWVDFAGSLGQEVFFQGAAGTRRLAAQFDASGLATGAHEFTLVARAWYGSTFQETTAPVTVPVLNERQSPYGAGWSVAGLQRLHLGGDGVAGDIVISEGDGSVARFEHDFGEVWLSPPGDWSELNLNAAGQIERIYPGGRVLTFDSAGGRLLQAEDRFGNRTTFDYSLGKLTSVTDPAGKTITLGYGSDGKLAWIEGAGGRRTHVTIDADGDLTAIEDPTGGFPLQATYDAEHRMRTRTDAGGGSWGFAYDFAGKIAADTMPQVQVDGSPGRPVVAFSSPATRLLPDPGAGEGTSSNPAQALSPGPVEATSTDPRGITTTHRVGRWRAATRVVAPVDSSMDVTTTITRDDSARVVEVARSTGRTTTLDWEGPDLVQRNQVHVEYESTYHLPVHIEGSGVPERWLWYGADGALDSVLVTTVNDTLTGGPAAAGFRHDGAGRLTMRIDPGGDTTGIAYRSSGYQNRASVTSPADQTTHFLHDAYGRRVATALPTGDTTHVGYDALNRTTLAVNTRGDTTGLAYGPAGLSQLTDPEGQTYGFTRNALGWVTERIDPRGNATIFAHDAAGNVIRRTGRAGGTVSFGYNVGGMRISRTADGRTVSISLGPDGRTVAASTAASTDTVEFDDRGRREREVTVRDGTRFEIAYDYGPAGNRTAVRLVSPVEDSARMVPSDVWMLKWLVGPSGDSTRVRLNDDRRTVNIGYPTGDTLRRSISATGRIFEMEWDDPTLNAAFGRAFGLDSLGRVESRQIPGTDTIRTFSYDDRGWLTGWEDVSFEFGVTCDGADPVTGSTCTTSGEGLTVEEVAFSYDRVGNRTDSGATLEAGNRLTSLGDHTMTWDAAGRLTHKQGAGLDQRFFWSATGRLDSVETNGTVTRFAYDALGRRVSKSTGGQTTQYVYSGDHVLLELDGQEAIEARYTYFPGVDRPRSVERDGATYYYARGMTNSVVGLFDEAGEVANRYRYGPWGEPQVVSETVENEVRYTGRRWDASTGLYYYRARYYDPDTGRLISQDPLGLAAGTNPYAYAGNDPVNALDPTGLCTLTIGISKTNDLNTTSSESTSDIVCKDGGDGNVLTGFINFLVFSALRGAPKGGLALGSGAIGGTGSTGSNRQPYPAHHMIKKSNGQVGLIITQDSLSCTAKSVFTHAVDRGMTTALVLGATLATLGAVSGFSVGTAGGPPGQVSAGLSGAIAGWALGSAGGFTRGFESGLVSGATEACVLR